MEPTKRPWHADGVNIRSGPEGCLAYVSVAIACGRTLEEALANARLIVDSANELARDREPIIKAAQTVFDMLVEALKQGVAPTDLKQMFVESIEAAFMQSIEPWVLKERERCQKSVKLFVELCAAGTESGRAEAIREKLEEITDINRINDNPLWGPISLAYRALENRLKEACGDDKKETQIGLEGGDWRVRRRGDELTIVDAQGRQRHCSRGHDMTGVHLAMALAKLPFESAPNLDEALRMMANDWDKGAPP